MRDRPPHRGLRPLLFTNSVVVFLTSHRIYRCKGCETGPTVYRPYPRRLESLTVCRTYQESEPPSPLISWVNSFLSRIINRTASFPRKVSYFCESRMSPGKKWSWMKSNSEARPSTVFLFYYTSIFTILQPLGSPSGWHEIKVNELPDWDWAWSDGTKAANWGSRKGYLCERFFFCRHTSHI